MTTDEAINRIKDYIEPCDAHDGDHGKFGMAIRKVLAELAEARRERDKLQAFKDWVHSYLDGKGVPHHPPGTHGASGCRIGDRMDYLWAERVQHVRRVAELQRAIDRYSTGPGECDQALHMAKAACESLKLNRETTSPNDIREAIDALRRQLDRWEDYYGCEEPSDSVIGSAAGKIVAERNVEIATLKRELSSYIRVHGCISCGEQHGGMCPPHEVRTTGMAAVNGVKDRLIGELRRQLADAEKERDDWKESLRKAEANYCQHWRPELCAPPTAIRADAPSVQADVFDQRVADVPKQAETPATVTEGEYRAFGHILARMATPDHALRLAKFDDSDECSCICAALNAKRHDDAAVERLVEALRLCLMCGLPPHDISGQRMWQQARDALAPFGTEGSVE